MAAIGFFDFLKQPDINKGVIDFHNTDGAVLLDVRTPQEYLDGHIPGSRNVSLQQLDKISAVTDNKDVPLFVYCHSGGRSRQATALLRHMGYTDVRNIGGITAYSGKVER